MKVKVPPSMRSSLRILGPNGVLDPERVKKVRLQEARGTHPGLGRHNARENVIVTAAICKLRAWLSDHRKAQSVGCPIGAAAHGRESLLAAICIAVEPGGH